MALLLSPCSPVVDCKQGADLSSDLWSARLLDDNPSLIRETHLAYYRAGADVATSPSYQASYEGFLVSWSLRSQVVKCTSSLENGALLFCRYILLKWYFVCWHTLLRNIVPRRMVEREIHTASLPCMCIGIYTYECSLEIKSIGRIPCPLCCGRGNIRWMKHMLIGLGELRGLLPLGDLGSPCNQCGHHAGVRLHAMIRFAVVIRRPNKNQRQQTVCMRSTHEPPHKRES